MNSPFPNESAFTAYVCPGCGAEWTTTHLGLTCTQPHSPDCVALKAQLNELKDLRGEDAPKERKTAADRQDVQDIRLHLEDALEGLRRGKMRDIRQSIQTAMDILHRL